MTFGNSIVRIANDHGLKNVVLSATIIAEDRTVEKQVAAIERTFAKGRELLLHWQKVPERMHLSQRDILDQIPDPSKLTLARLRQGV